MGAHPGGQPVRLHRVVSRLTITNFRDFYTYTRFREQVTSAWQLDHPHLDLQLPAPIHTQKYDIIILLSMRQSRKAVVACSRGLPSSP